MLQFADGLGILLQLFYVASSDAVFTFQFQKFFLLFFSSVYLLKRHWQSHDCHQSHGAAKNAELGDLDILVYAAGNVGDDGNGNADRDQDDAPLDLVVFPAEAFGDHSIQI